MSRRADYPYVNSSLIEESVVDNAAWLAPGPADGQRPRDSSIEVVSPLFCRLVTSRTTMAARSTAHR